MEPATYIALGLDGGLVVAVVLLALCLRSSADARDVANRELVAAVRSDSQRAIDDQAHLAALVELRLTLQAQTARADALQEFISHEAKQTDPGSGLDPDDVAGRVLRLSQRWAAAVPASRGADGSGAAAAVRDPAPT